VLQWDPVSEIQSGVKSGRQTSFLVFFYKDVTV